VAYDLFVSYSRSDNGQSRITQLVESIQAEFAAFAGRPLVPFFDATEIRGMEDWRHRILQGLRESRLLLACLSPSYLKSEYCEWEFNEYLKHEIARAHFGDGVAPIYFVEVPGWGEKGFEQKYGTWVAELRRRQHFDLRPWFHLGEESLHEVAVRERMSLLNVQLKDRITRGERAEHRLGNVGGHNPHFIGRTTELRRLRETVAFGGAGVLTIVHGLGGMGKTALAIEYARAFAHEYGGGCWQVRTEGKEDLRAVIAELSSPLGLGFDEDEGKDTARQFERVLAELRRLADSHEPHRSLLLLDNVDRPRLLEPAQTQCLPPVDWLHVVATTRLGGSEMHGKHRDRVFLPVDELPEADAVELIETYQPGGSFLSDSEREAAREVASLLSRFTLGVETAAVYLGQFADDVTCVSFLARLKKEGLAGLDSAAEQSGEGVRHGEKSVVATLGPTLDRLSEPEKLALRCASLLPADHVALSWIRALVAEVFSNLGTDAEPGYPDPWLTLLRRLLSLRLFQKSTVDSEGSGPVLVRIHRVVQDIVRRTQRGVDAVEDSIQTFVVGRALMVELGLDGSGQDWELAALRETGHSWLDAGLHAASYLGLHVSYSLHRRSDFRETIRLLRRVLPTLAASGGEYMSCLNVLGSACLHVGDYELSERFLGLALDKCRSDTETSGVWLSTTLSNLGALYGETDRNEAAEAHLREALELDRARFGSGDPRIAIRLSNLGKVLRERNKLTDAIEAAADALKIDQECDDPHDNVVAGDLSALANMLQDAGQSQRAHALLERAIAIDRSLPLGYRRQLAVDLRNLARVVECIARIGDAEPLLREALAIDTAVFGARSPTVAIDHNNLGVNLRHQNRLDEAVACHLEALGIDRERRGENHPKVALRLLNVAITLMMKDDLQRASELLREAWGIAGVRDNRLGLRILVIRAVLAVLRAERTDVVLGQIRVLLSRSDLTSVSVDPSWDHEPTACWCEARAEQWDAGALVSALFDAERHSRVTDSLGALEIWQRTACADLGHQW